MKQLNIDKKYLKELICPRCEGRGKDPASETYFREFKCNLCKGTGKIIMIKPEYYLGEKI